MENTEGVKILVYMIFEEQFLNSEEMIPWMPTTPTCLLEKDFHERMQRVLFIRSRIAACRWRKFFDSSYRKMLSSHEMYLTFVMFACINENKCYQNIFESFISVCALIKLLSEETLQKTGVNLCNLNPYIFDVFYESVLQRSFNKFGGFRRLVEYIREHRYQTLIENWKDLVSPDDPAIDNSTSSEDPTRKDLDNKLNKVLRLEHVIEIETNLDEVAKDFYSILMAKTVLSFATIELPRLPSERDLIKSVIEYRLNIVKTSKYSEEKRRIVTSESLEAKEVDLNGCSDSNSYSKTDCFAKNQYNIEWHENIVQEVIRYNHSKISNNEYTANRVLEKAEGVLEPLKDKIKSLIEVLDEYDKK